MTTTYQATPTPRSLAVMAALCEDPGRPMTTPEITELVVTGIPDWQQALTRAGSTLRDHARSGRVVQAGISRGGRPGGPAVIWAPTDAGREWLTAFRAGTLTAKQRRDAGRREKEAARARRIERMVTLYRGGATIVQVGAEIGIDPAAVYRWLVGAGEIVPGRRLRHRVHWRTAQPDVPACAATAGPSSPNPSKVTCPDCQQLSGEGRAQ